MGNEAEHSKVVAGADIVALLKLCVVGLLVGLVAGAGASGFVAAQHYLSQLLWQEVPALLGVPSAPWWLVVVLPLIGAVLVYAAMQLPGEGGHSPLEGFGLNIGPKELASVLLAALAGLSFGAVLGPEAPLLAIGTAAGAAVLRSAKHPARQVMMIVGAMAAAGAIFGNPLITAILLLELAAAAGTQLASPKVLLPSLSGLAGSYLLQVGVGPWTGLAESQLSPFQLAEYSEVRLVDLVWGVPLAVVVAVIVVAALQIANWWQGVAVHAKLSKLLISAAVVGGSAVAVMQITGEPAELIVMSGQSALGDYLGLTSIATALVVLAGKFIGYVACLGGGFRGGMIFPAIALAAIIASTAVIALGANEGIAGLAAAAIAAAVAASLRLPFTAVLLATLLTISAGPAVTVMAILGSVIGMLLRFAGERFLPKLAAMAV